MAYERQYSFARLTSCSGARGSLLGSVQDAEDAEDNVMLDGTEVSLPAEDIYQVQDASGRLLGHSLNWTGPRMDVLAEKRQKEGSFRPRKALSRVKIAGLRVVDPGEKGAEFHATSRSMTAPP